MTEIVPDNSPAPFIAIIVAAGSGTRFGGELPKQYQSLLGKPVLRHTIERFLACPNLVAVYVVINPAHQDLYDAATKGLALPPPISGGHDRQTSVRKALDALAVSSAIKTETRVLIHDAARPCLTPSLIQSVVAGLSQHQAVTAAVPISDTLRRCDQRLDGCQILGETVDRTNLWSMQTPQGFHFGILAEAHDVCSTQSFTDDTAIVSANGTPVFPVPAERTNIKITTPEDLAMAELFLSARHRQRTAIGYDVHAFGDASDNIRIGGVDIQHTHKLAGHSDADVVLHAITDAIYGVLGDGDIGSHFPPSDMTWKGKDSAFFLQSAAEDLKSRGGLIDHVDTVIICESPKIGPHRGRIRHRIADLLQVPLDRVSVKATTTEGLGFTGRREGIAAQAVLTARVPDAD